MSRPSNDTGKRPTLWLVASALLITACSGGEVTGDGASSSSAIASSTTVPLVETTTTATTTKLSDDVALAAVLAALDAKNRFDLDGWLMAFEGGKRQWPVFADELLMNANQHWEVVEPCQVTTENADGDTVVECVISNTDDFWGAGGIFDTKNQRFTVNPDGLITTKSNSFSSDRRDSFNRAFHQWLSDTHPDVYAEMDPGYITSAGPGFDTQNPDHMLVAVDYVEEFVAQSDTYPLDATDQ